MNLCEISKATVSAISEIPSDCRNKLLKVALSLIQPSVQDRSKAIEKLSEEYSISSWKIQEILGVYLSLVHFFIESTNKEFNAKLIELGFPADFVESLPLASNRNEVVSTILDSKRADFGRLVSLKWRMDISLSASSLVKKIPPSVILCLQLKDGRQISINVDIKTFHKLRFNVALLLKELANAKNSHPVFK